MDSVDPTRVERAEQLAAATPGVARIEQMRMRWNGHNLTATTRIAVDPSLSLHEAQHIATDVRATLEDGIKRLNDTVVELA